MNVTYADLQQIKHEYDSIKRLLNNYGLTMTNIRREIRKRCGQGNYKHKEKVIHRSKNCKVFFDQAKNLAQDSNKILCLHLLAALLEDSEGIIKQFLEERKIKPQQVCKKALLYARAGLKGRNNDSYII